MTILPILEILLANLIWGFGFVASIWALESLTWIQIFLYRFLIAGVTGLIIFLILEKKELLKSYFSIAFIPSIFLSLEIIFQIFSLQYTTATEGGFLFILYIIMIPIMEYVLFKKHLPKKQMLWILLGLVGSVLMMKSKEITIGKGEIAMLVAAFFAGAHIISIDRLDKSKIKTFYLNAFQLMWGAIFTAPFYFFIKHDFSGHFSTKSVVGLISLIFGSTLIAYFLQLKAQLKISPSMISVLFLLESAFSAIFAYWLLGDRLSSGQWIGAAIISISALAVSIDFLKSQKD